MRGFWFLADNDGGEVDSGAVNKAEKPLAFDLGKNDPKSWNDLEKEFWDPTKIPEDLQDPIGA